MRDAPECPRPPCNILGNMQHLNRAERDHRMRADRATGLTVRALARRYGVSKSQAHRITQGVELHPPPPRFVVRIVPTAGGGFAHVVTPEPGPPHRAYKVRHGRRV